jgi:hypothetical protein
LLIQPLNRTGGSAESEEQYEQLADADDKAAFLRTLDRREKANLASFMRAKYADDLGRVQQEIADELEVRLATGPSAVASRQYPWLTRSCPW